MVTVDASCENCGAAAQAADDTLEDQMIVCAKCGTELGTYGDIQQVMFSKGRSEIERAVADMINDANKSG